MALKKICNACQYPASLKHKNCSQCKAPLPAAKAARWAVDARDGLGRRIRLRGTYLKTLKKLDAEIELARKQGVAWLSKAKRDGPTLAELVATHFASPSAQGWRGAKHRRVIINKLIERLGPDVPATALTTQRIHQFQQRMLAQGFRHGGINRPIEYLNATFNWAVKLGKLETNPIAGYASLKELARDRVLSHEEYMVLLRALPERTKVFTELLFRLPLRLEEALQLTWEQVDLKDERGVITFSGTDAQRTKSGRMRVVPLYFSHLKTSLGALPSRWAKGRVFNLSDGQVRADFKRALAQAGIKDFRLHDLKHCAITNLILAGVPQHEVEFASDHKDLQISRRYTNLRAETILNRHPWEYSKEDGLIHPIDGVKKSAVIGL